MCIKCKDGRCERVCSPGIIESLDRAKVYQGCNIIGGGSTDPLVISIKREGEGEYKIYFSLEIFI